MNTGIWYAIGAYTLWGLLPVYWKRLQHVPALQLMSHRVVWSFVSLCTFLVLTRRWSRFRAAIGERRVLRTHLITAALIGVNWLTYVWAVNAGFIVETSLGYFINPLLSVAMGVVFLRERLRPLQWTAVGIAGVGVFYLTFVYGAFPWIAITLALAFGFYGLVKKTAPLGSLYGLTLETGVLLLPTLGYLLFCEVRGEGAFLHTGFLFDLLMVGAGPITAVPLLLFAAAAQRIPLSLVGILQYIAPTLQFLLGVLVYREPFPPARLIGFSLVWIALAILALDAGLTRRARILVKPQRHRGRGGIRDE
ncbi:MAG TPA: EamA family transporter RarD [Thermoflexia bacterium]|jgi:chloramphenicol-sensitive protein RarD|nr:EamA family transporter RarD [Thermoflexia bacterium]